MTDIDSLTFFAGTTGETFTTNIATRGRTITDYDTTNFTQNIDTIAGASAEVLYEYESPNVAIRFDNLPVIAVPGTDFVFNLVVQNMEASPTPSGVRATLTLPNGTTFDPSSFTFAGWTASLTGNIVTFVRTNSMAASLTERLPIKLTITNGAANNIALITKVEIPETDYDPTNNQRTANIPKNQPPILSTISPFSIVNSGAVFKLPANILQAIDPNGSEPSEFNEGITIDFVKNFVITRLPNSANGELFLDELGATPATLNQVLTIQQGKNLYFKPKIGFVGNVSFNFTANDTFDAKNPPITAIFNLTNTNSQIGTGQYYGNNSLFGALSWSNSSNPGQNQTNSVNPQNTNNLTNNSQISQGLNSQKAVQTNSTNNSQDTNNSSNNQTNQEQNLSKRLIFRLVNGEIFDENNNKLSSGEILVDKGGEIDKNKINQIIQKYLEFQSQKINSIQNKAIMDKMEIVIQQNGKIISKIITNKINNSDQELETAQNVFLEKENSQNAKNLVRTGAFENFGQMTIGVLAILGAIGLLWTYFTGLKKGKNENKIELGEQILR